MADVPTIRGQVTRTQYRAGRRRSLQALAANITSADGNVVNPSTGAGVAHGCSLATSGTQTVPGQITFASANFDTDTWFSLTHPTRITVTITGLYFLSGTIVLQDSPADQYALSFYKNGVASGINGQTQEWPLDVPTGVASPYFHSFSFEQLVSLTSGDYVELNVDAGGSETINAAYFSAVLLGTL